MANSSDAHSQNPQGREAQIKSGGRSRHKEQDAKSSTSSSSQRAENQTKSNSQAKGGQQSRNAEDK